MGWDTSEIGRLTADLKQAGLEAQRKAPTVVRKAATDVEAFAKIHAPVDTGYLRGSISADIQPFRAVIGPTASYGMHVEKGTSRQRPQPYMEPALRKVEPGFVAAMQKLAEGSLE